jgi:crooked neck
LKVWVSYAKFEAAMPLEEETLAEEEDREPEEGKLKDQKRQRVLRARGVFERACESLRTSAPDQKEERAMLLEEWRETEQSFGEFGDVAAVQKKMPRRVKRKRPISAEDGTPAGFEEYPDYIFPEETGMAPNLKILEAAYKWKKQKVGSES